MNDQKIVSMKVLYDNKEKKAMKAYIETENGKIRKLEDTEEIRKELRNLKNQEGKPLSQVSKLKTLYIYDPKLAKQDIYEERTRIIQDWTNKREREYRIANGKVNKRWVPKAVAGALAGVILVGCASSMKQNQSSEASIEETMEDDLEDEKTASEVVQEKVNPESWEQYMSDTYNPNAEQKMFAKKVMETLIEPNVKTKTIEGNSITYGLTPQQAMAFSLYYNSNLYSNEKILAILGDYKITGDSDESKDLINQVNDAVEMILLSWVIADNKDEMILPTVEDTVVNDLIEKYSNLIISYKQATTTKDKADRKKAVEAALQDDFIDASNGVINLQDHPAAHIILNTVPAVFTSLNDALDAGINKVLVGTEGNYEVATDGGYVNGKEVSKNAITIPETRGLVDDPCAIYIQRWDGFEAYRQEKTLDKNTIERNNETVSSQVEYWNESIQAVKKSDLSESDRKVKIELYEQQIELLRMELKSSEYDEITLDTYEYDFHDEHIGVLIPIMEEYVKVKGLTDVDTIKEVFRQAVITKIQNDKIKNPGPFNPKTNPAGGKVGDTYSETKKVTGDAAKAATTEAQRKQAEKEAAKKAGAVSNDEMNATNAEIDRLIKEILAEKDALLQYYIDNGPTAAEYRSDWANSKYEAVRNQYNIIKNEGIRVYNEIKKVGETTTEEGKDNTPSHDQNPNQNGNNPSSTTPAPSEDSGKDPETNSNNNSSSSGSTSNTDSSVTDDIPNIPSHDQNPNQNQNQSQGQGQSGGSTGGSSTTDIDDGTIGDITTDPTDVWDPSSAGEYQGSNRESDGIALASVESDSIDVTGIMMTDEEMQMYADIMVEEMASNPTVEGDSEKQLSLGL